MICFFSLTLCLIVVYCRLIVGLSSAHPLLIGSVMALLSIVYLTYIYRVSIVYLSCIYRISIVFILRIVRYQPKQI